MIQTRLQRVFDLVRPGIPVPTILQFRDPVGPTRARELEGYGAEPTYTAKFLPQIHADMTEDVAKRLSRGGLNMLSWYDEPSYAFNFRSSPSQIRARVQERIQRNTTAGNPHPVPREAIRAHLGAGRPAYLDRSDVIVNLEDVRRFTKSKDIYDEGRTGKGVLVAVLDTGVNDSHPMLEGQVKEHLSFVPEDAGGDGQGHGTWCGSAIAGLPTEYNGKIEPQKGRVLQGMAPDAQILAIKVLTSEGTGATSGVIQGIEAAIEREAHLMSMSLGSLLGGAGLTPDSQAINEAAKRGIHCVIAAGNSFGFLTVGSPGSANAAITVGAVAMKNPSPGTVASFSSKGPTSDGRIKPTISAPGGNIRPGEVILGATSPGSAIDKESMDGGWALLRGTSMATPTVAGILAQVVHELPKDRELVEEVLARSTASRLPFPTKDNRTGWGPIDATRLVSAMKTRAGLGIRLYSNFMDRRSRPIAGKALDLAAMAQSLPAPNPQNLRLTLL